MRSSKASSVQGGTNVSGKAIDKELAQLEKQLSSKPTKKGWLTPSFQNPKLFTFLLVCFASMGGLLLGINQSLINGANLYMPTSLKLTTSHVNLIISGLPLGTVGGALMFGPLNESFGRKNAILILLVLYTIGGALEVEAINFGMMIAGRIILGLGVGLEGGTMPVYVEKSITQKYRGNLISFYQFNIALGEVFGYVVAAIFVNVRNGN